MSGTRKPLQGLTTALKERLIQDSLQRRLRKSEREREQSAVGIEGLYGNA